MWYFGQAGGAPLIQIRSIDELDRAEEAAEEGVPPTAAAATGGAAGAPTAMSALNEAERQTGVDIDGDGDVGMQDSDGRPRRKRVWNGATWVMNWEYQKQVIWDDANWQYTDDAEWSLVRLPSVDSPHVLIEVVDPDEKIPSEKSSGRVGLAVVAPDHGHGWVSVYDESHREIGQAYVEFKKKKKNKPDVPIAPAVSPGASKFSVTPVASGLGVRVSSAGIVLGYVSSQALRRCLLVVYRVCS